MKRQTLPPLPGSHAGFVTFMALALALLYVETGAFAVFTANMRPLEEAVFPLALGFFVVGGGYLAAFLLPPRTSPFPEGKFPDATPVLRYLLRQMITGIIWIVATGLVTLALYMHLVWPNLVAGYNLIKDLFIYTLVGIIYGQGLTIYVRYLNFLYRVRMDNPVKVMVAEVSLMLLTLVLGLYLLTLDVLHLAAVPDPAGILGLHVTVRAIWLTIIILVAFAWHFRWVAEH